MDAIGSIVLFVIVPVAVALIVVAFVLGPSWSRAGRWRPGEPWRDDPVLLSGDSAEGESSAVAGVPSAQGSQDDADVAAVAGVGASSALVSTSAHEIHTGVPEVPTATVTTQFGGARGRW
jgi:hypothetical protein